MDSFLVGLKALFDTLGSTVMLPIIIFVFALVLGTKPGKAFRSAVIIGVAFIGINLIIGLMWGSIDGVAKAMVANAGIERDIIDVGWPAAAAIAFGTDVGLWVIPVALLVNIVLLALRLTKTLNVDVWNFWHFAFAGSLVYAATGNLTLGIASAAVAAALMLFFADWTAPAVQDFYNLPGISIPHGTSTAYVALAIPINLLLDRIPGLKDLDADPDAIERRFGPTFGDPMVMGLIIGIILGLIGYFGEFASAGFIATFGKILLLGVNLAAVMVLLPRMVSILMEGLIPISEAAREFMQKRASGREVYIGLDSAILIGHPAVISASLVLVPIAILLSIILPGNRMLLFADLAIFPFVIALTGPVTKGNVVRMIIIGTLIIIVGFYLGNAMAPAMTDAAANAGFAFPEGASQISSVGDGFIWIPWAFMVLGGGLGWIGVILFTVVMAVFWYFYKKNTAAWEAAAGGPAAGD
ncbi:MAG: PTS galactitol transporter subunit IIC [Anaerolineales bacterium]|nr:PTS galactitol transporter subunit IIC [Anaerolineales bacterium]